MGKFNKCINNLSLFSSRILFAHDGLKNVSQRVFSNGKLGHSSSSHRSLPLTSLWNSRLVVCLVISMMTDVLSVLQGLKHEQQKVTLRERLAGFVDTFPSGRVQISGLKMICYQLLSLQVIHCTVRYCMWLIEHLRVDETSQLGHCSCASLVVAEKQW